MNEKKYITYDVAKILATKNIYISGNYYYHNGKFVDSDDINPILSDEMIQAPSLSIMQDWLREHHNIYVNPIPSCSNNAEGYNRYYWTYQIFNIQDDDTIDESYMKLIDETVEENEKEFISYEEALNEGIKEALNLI